MKLEDESKIRNMIRESSLWEISIVSVLILPTITGFWLSLLGIANDSPERIKAILVVVIVYIISVGLAKFGQSKAAKQANQKRILVNRLLRRKNRKASFSNLVENSHDLLTDTVIQELITEFPKVFVPIKIKGKGKGVKLLEEEEE
ncbi:MAG TPA: hypothetical protein DCE52_11495 [Rhodobacteraceae bacterium]|nr:hypothetical protein [Paracoccaceae bacterium]